MLKKWPYYCSSPVAYVAAGLARISHNGTSYSRAALSSCQGAEVISRGDDGRSDDHRHFNLAKGQLKGRMYVLLLLTSDR
eukprot:scaffold279392_cov67-Attheya_sp.AAC.2